MQYEVHSGRFDVDEHCYTSFDADSDEEAIEKFTEMTEKESNAWDNMHLIQVVVQRKTKRVASIGRQRSVHGENANKVIIHEPRN